MNPLVKYQQTTYTFLPISVVEANLATLTYFDFMKYFFLYIKTKPPEINTLQSNFYILFFLFKFNKTQVLLKVCMNST